MKNWMQNVAVALLFIGLGFSTSSEAETFVGVGAPGVSVGVAVNTQPFYRPMPFPVQNFGGSFQYSYGGFGGAMPCGVQGVCGGGFGGGFGGMPCGAHGCGGGFGGGYFGFGGGFGRPIGCAPGQFFVRNRCVFRRGGRAFALNIGIGRFALGIRSVSF